MEVVAMPDVLIRDVPEEVVAAVDERAARFGLSRTEYLRRRLAEESSPRPRRTTTEQDLDRIQTVFADVSHPEVMRGAWSCDSAP